ncbi:hypothetical protein [Streptomyces smyrnaeus]|uniref:hypothetical protein n=1 Tax=Streptomyces smyrnaeus TaxID=1387713 RepID=UPI0036D1C9E2
MPSEDTAAELLAEARKDYGTPQEREQRQADARTNLAMAKARASESAQTERWRS